VRQPAAWDQGEFQSGCRGLSVTPSFSLLSSVSVWVLHGLQSLEVVPALPRSASFSDFGIPSAVSRSFVLFSPFFPVVLPFLKYVFTEASPAWLKGSAVSCGQSIGAGWKCFSLAQGSPRPLLREAHYCNLPTVKTWTWKFSTVPLSDYD